jgi:hypothetical protein
MDGGGAGSLPQSIGATPAPVYCTTLTNPTPLNPLSTFTQSPNPNGVSGSSKTSLGVVYEENARLIEENGGISPNQ